MRITRYRNIEHNGYFNPETQAHKLWKEDNAIADFIHRIGGSPRSKAQAYRDTIDHVFSPSISLGYPILATTDSGDCLCIDCAKKIYMEERTDVTVDIYYEGPVMFCDECNTEIESAYGNPWEEETE